MKRLLRLLRTLHRRPLVQHKGIRSIWMLPWLLKLSFSAHLYIFLFNKWIRLERSFNSTISLQTETMRPPPPTHTHTHKKKRKEKRKTYLKPSIERAPPVTGKAPTGCRAMHFIKRARAGPVRLVEGRLATCKYHHPGSVGYVTMDAVEMKFGRAPHGLEILRQAAGYENRTGPGGFVKAP